jgi:hypothetical protein
VTCAQFNRRSATAQHQHLTCIAICWGLQFWLGMLVCWEGALSGVKARVLFDCSCWFCDVARKMLAVVGGTFHGGVACITSRGVVYTAT